MAWCEDLILKGKTSVHSKNFGSGLIGCISLKADVGARLDPINR